MIEITAKLCRGPVYFTSEDVKCFVTLKHVMSSADGDDQPQGQHSGSRNEMLALAGAQIYCHCSLDESRVQFIASDGDSQTGKLPTTTASSSSFASRATSFDPSKSEAGHVVFATTPKILFCGLSLAPNESRTFVYQERIPNHVPPSYYGSAVKYLYKLTIGTQRVKSGMQLLRIPLRILPAVCGTSSNGESLDHVDSSASACNGQNGVTAESAAVLTEEEKMELLIHRLECLTARKNPSSYVITNAFGQVARFCLLKSSFKLGEDVIGIFNFSHAVVPCVQFSVTLQSEEVISEACKFGNATAATGAGASAAGIGISNHSRHHDFCLHTEQTQIILPIPLTITPTFRTNVVSLCWRLHFEFVTTKPSQVMTEVISDSQGFMAKAAPHLDVQTMVWDLPLTVYPNHPLQVARGLQLPSSSTIVV